MFIFGKMAYLADIIRLYGEFPKPAVDEDRQLDHCRSAIIRNRIQRRPYCPAGMENIIHQDYRLVIQVERNISFVYYRESLSDPDIVSVHAYVKSAERDVYARAGLD